MTLARKLLSSLALVVAAAGWMAFGTLGGFKAGEDDGIPNAVISPADY